jgi:hypothetical protein
VIEEASNFLSRIEVIRVLRRKLSPNTIGLKAVKKNKRKPTEFNSNMLESKRRTICRFTVLRWKKSRRVKKRSNWKQIG